MFSSIQNRSVFLIAVFLSGILWACGPSFPNSYLVGSDTLLLQSPRYSFDDEIMRISQDGPVEFEVLYVDENGNPLSNWQIRSLNSRLRVLDAEIQDLYAVFEMQGQTSETIDKLVQEYRALRKAIEEYKNEHHAFVKDQMKGSGEMPEPAAAFSVDQISEHIPQEFAMYLEGVIYYRTDRKEKAVDVWQQILELPAEGRQFKSTWAAYMIARVYHQQHKYEQACQMYQAVRQYAQDGFADSQSLAATSLGDEAAIYLREGKYEKAIDLYLLQARTGDQTAVPSLKMTAMSVFTDCDQEGLTELIRLPLVRQVLIGYALAFGPSEINSLYLRENYDLTAKRIPQNRLLDAIEKAELEDIANADRLAMIAYKVGDYERAQRWMDVADMDSLISRRVRAKLLLRDGRIEEAAVDLAFIARGSYESSILYTYAPDNRFDNSYQINSELGTLYVSQALYAKAADVLLQGGNWIDGAYILERVLTLEELQNYVDANWPESMLEPINEQDGYGPQGIKASTIRYLLARRLSRKGLHETARDYYPEQYREDFNQYVSALESALDMTLPDRERADAYWKAAWLIRHNGMELIGFELDPDWQMLYSGNFYLGNRLEARQALQEKNEINVPDLDELNRIRQEPALPDKRYHYRYVASDLAWEAAALMPDQDVELARRLCLAGTWHRDRDNEYADVFYKSLVLRCGATALGKDADRIRWFPKIPDTLTQETPFEPTQDDAEVSE